MKKGMIVLGLVAAVSAFAEDVTQYMPGADEGIVYFLPKTALKVDVVATKVTYTPGEFCQYAGRYLRLNNVTAQPEQYWEIKKIEVYSAGVPDSTKAYVMKLKDKSVASNIELTNDGIVKAINTSYSGKTAGMEYVLEKVQPHENARRYMTEEILMAGSTAKMAELTAKEIYNIRESKNLIIRGQADAMPKDGASMKLALDNLNKQEKALTEMFAGITDREDKVFTFWITPEENMQDKVVSRFSRQLGMLSADNLAGEPVYADVTSSAPVGITSAEEEKRKKTSGIIYNIPGKGTVTIHYRGKTMFNAELPVTQFGYTEVLTDGLFDKKVNTRVIFNPDTGGILKIEKD